MGAVVLDVDPPEGWARFAFYEPRQIDFQAVNKAMVAASYQVRGFELEVGGQIVRGTGANGDGDAVLEVTGTGQKLRLQLSDKAVPDGPVWIHAKVSGWDTADPLLVVTKIKPGVATGS